MRLLKTPFVSALSGTFYVSTSFFIGSVFSYLVHVFLGRMLTVHEYGEFVALLSLLNIFSIPTNALSTTLVKLSAELKSENKKSYYSALFVRSLKYLFYFCLALFFGFLLLQKPISAYLKIADSSLIFFFAVYFVVTFLTVVPSSFLQGFSFFGKFSVVNVLAHALRFVFVIALVYFGFGVVGAYFGMIIAGLFVLILSFVFLRFQFDLKSTQSLAPYFKPIVKLSLASLFTSLGIIFLTNSDVVLVKHFFEGDLAGLYSATTTVGKVLLFGIGTVSIVMFPKISAAFANKENVLLYFKNFLFVQIMASLAGFSAFFLFPDKIIGILFGPKFMAVVGLIRLFSVFIVLFVFCQFLMLFFLAVNRRRISLAFVVASLGQILLIFLFHNSLETVIYINILCVALLLAVLILYFVKYVCFDYHSGIQKRSNN